MNRIALGLLALFCLSGCSQIQLASHVAKKVFPAGRSSAMTTNSQSQGTFKVGTPYKIQGKKYYPQESYDLVETGIASWYGPQFHGKQTANGEIFDMDELTAAHKTLQMPSLVRVTNLENGKSLIVRVNDRGPYKRGRLIDLSRKSAELLGFKNQGTAKVKLEVLKQESLQVAEVAKRGESTKGFEVALNQGKPMPAPVAETVFEPYQIASNAPVSAPAAQGVPVQPVTRQIIASPLAPGSDMQQIIPGHTRNGAFYPDPVITERAVTPSNIYVQAGSFSVYENAVKLSQNLQRFAQTEVQPALVNGKQFYHVRLGHNKTVAGADQVLSDIVSAGNNNAIIVVD
mgnify:CR=1 FL=1